LAGVRDAAHIWLERKHNMEKGNGMALRNIVFEGDEILRKKSKEVTEYNARIGILIDDMWDTMQDAAGVGLAAPQVGVLRRVVVIDVSEPPKEGVVILDLPGNAGSGRWELINPEIESAEGEVLENEGCLSVPGVIGAVRRPRRVRVKAYDRRGNPLEVEGEGMLAKALCHEIDHLNGILFTDIADSVEDVKE
jgi:peptide deformylase